MAAGRHPTQAQALAAGSADVYNAITQFEVDNTGAADATPAIHAAIDAARATNGGTIFLPLGTYRCDGQLKADQSVAIRLEGADGRTAGRAPGTQLRYTGTAPSFISARSTTGFELHRLGIFYTNSGFTGAVVDFSHAVDSDSALALVSDCVFAVGGRRWRR